MSVENWAEEPREPVLDPEPEDFIAAIREVKDDNGDEPSTGALAKTIEGRDDPYKELAELPPPSLPPRPHDRENQDEETPSPAPALPPGGAGGGPRHAKHRLAGTNKTHEYLADFNGLAGYCCCGALAEEPVHGLNADVAAELARLRRQADVHTALADQLSKVRRVAEHCGWLHSQSVDVFLPPEARAEYSTQLGQALAKLAHDLAEMAADEPAAAAGGESP